MSGLLVIEYKASGAGSNGRDLIVDRAPRARELMDEGYEVATRTVWDYGLGRRYVASRWTPWKTEKENGKMSEQTNVNEDLNQWPEMPSVIWFKFELNGFETSLTLRGTSGLELLTKAQAAMTKVSELGGTPISRNGSRANGADAKICPIHNVKMQKYEKDGRSWWSHKAVDPETNEDFWCKGKSK